MLLLIFNSLNILFSITLLAISVNISNQLMQERFFLIKKYRNTNTALLVMLFSLASYSMINVVFFGFSLFGSGIEVTAISIKCFVQTAILNVVVCTFLYLTGNIK